MTSKNATKRAFMLSLLSLLMCCTMLLGTTFAWFTDTVTSTGNRIVAGTLKVDLLKFDGNIYDSIANGKGDIFNDAEGKNGANWEPGKTEIVYLAVENKGTLALKYDILLNVEDGGLADALEYAVLDNHKTADGKAPAADWATLSAGAATGDIVAGDMPILPDGQLAAYDKNTDVDTHYFALAVHMKEDAGNEFMEKDIEIDVKVMATQLNSESDSFGSDYDANATYGTYAEVASPADFDAALANAKADEPLSIVLNSDIEWVTEGHHGENDETPASIVTIDGQGKYTLTATGAGVTPIGDNNAPLILKNLTVKDESVSYAENAWEFTYLELGGSSLTCENVIFADEIQVGTEATFTNCTFESNEESVYAVWVEDGSATFTNCTFTGYRGLKTHEAYGSEVSAVIVKDCTFKDITKKPGLALGTLNADTVVSITGSSFINCQAGDQDKYIYETDTDVSTITFTESNNTVLVNATFVSTAADLVALSAKAFTGNNGKAEEANVILEADINMQNAEFSAMIAQRGDTLNIIGNGHKISNVKVVSGANDNTTGQAAMFYCYPNSTLKVSNLTLENITVTTEANGSGYGAAVVGYGEGTIVLDNVDVKNATVTGVKSSGMLVGHLSGSLVATNCDVAGTVTLADFAEEANGHYAGKYIGTLAGPATLNNCTANVTVSGNLNAANIGEVYGRKTAAGSSSLEYATDQTSFAAAINSGSTTVTLDKGNFTMPEPDLRGKTLTITGTKDTVIDLTAVDARDQFVTGANIVFDGVTLNFGTANYMGLANTKSLTYKNCKINGLQFLYGDNVTFENCDLNANGAEHCVWTYGAKNVTFTECDFTYGDRGINCYSDNDVVGGKQTVNFIDCTFTTANTSSAGAVEINSYFFSVGIEVNMDGCTAPANGEMAYVSPWDSTNGAKTTINIK